MKVLLAAALLAAPALAPAHDLWVERGADGFVVRDGVRGGALSPIEATKVKAIRCAAGTGAIREVIRSAAFAPREVRFPGPCAVVSVLHDGGIWSLTPDGQVNLPKSQAKGAVKSWASRRWAKWVDARSPRAGAPLGDALELVPVTSLAAARVGDEITLRVLSGGQPVPQAALDIDDRPLGDTDSTGEVRLRLPAAGVVSIATSVRRARPTPEADAELLEATLTFEVAR